MDISTGHCELLAPKPSCCDHCDRSDFPLESDPVDGEMLCPKCLDQKAKDIEQIDADQLPGYSKKQSKDLSKLFPGSLCNECRFITRLCTC